MLFANSILINCGSVGQSRQKGGQAHWVLVDTENKKYQMKATKYDTARLLDEIKMFDADFEYATKVLTR